MCASPASPVTVDVDGPVAHVTLYDRESGNALNPTTLGALIKAFDGVRRDENVRIIVLGHDGETFCRGMDLAYVATLPSDEIPTEFIGEFARLLRLIHEAPQPVFARIDGAVRAGGMGVMAATDVVLASEASSFSLTEVVFGLVPYNVLPYLIRRVGYATVRYLVLTACELTAQEAYTTRLIEEVHSDAAALDKRIRSHAKQVLRCSPAALQQAKQFVATIDGMPLEEASMSARTALRDWFQAPDSLEPLRAFQAGEALPWFARYKPKKK